jgi:hypothetical protein
MAPSAQAAAMPIAQPPRCHKETLTDEQATRGSGLPAARGCSAQCSAIWSHVGSVLRSRSVTATGPQPVRKYPPLCAASLFSSPACCWRADRDVLRACGRPEGALASIQARSGSSCRTSAAGFGAKFGADPEAVVTAWAACQLGRPAVRWFSWRDHNVRFFRQRGPEHEAERGRSREPRWSLRTLARGMRAPAQLGCGDIRAGGSAGRRRARRLSVSAPSRREAGISA